MITLAKETADPLVSVVVPCYNGASYLRVAIESILSQEYRHIQCIVIDGGSTDGTVDILKSYGKRIQWVSESDNGHASAINKGWRRSDGQILAWLNADDCWAIPDAVGRVVRYLQTYTDVDVVYGDCGLIDASGHHVGRAYLHRWDLRHAVEFADHCIPQPAAFIRREALDRVGMLDETIFTKDRELWLRISLSGKIAYYPCLLAYARNTPGISDDGKHVAPAIVEVTRKFYDLPNVPYPIRAIKSRAISNAYLRGADYARQGGRLWGLYWAYVLRAMMTDPTNYRQAARRLDRFVREWRIARRRADI